MLSKLNEKIENDIAIYGFSAYESNLENVTADNYMSHSHSFSEMFLLIDGDLDFFAAGTIFPLSQLDGIVISPDIPHGKNHIHTTKLRFFVLLVSDDFFEKNNCPQYRSVFLSKENTKRKIGSDEGYKSGFLDAYERLKKYTNDFSDTHSAIANSIIIEMLHILNNQINFAESYTENKQIRKIFEYIDANFKEKITLDDIADTLYLSKYHICKIFKTHVGYTIYKYITKKRLGYAKKLINEGMNITSACIEAGFSDYSSFYKAYVKENGTSIKNKQHINW